MPVIVSLLSLTATGVAVFNTGRATEQAAVVRVENAESEAAAAYLRDASARGLTVALEVGDQMFDAIARDNSGTVAEIAEFRRTVTPRAIGWILNTANAAKLAHPQAKFVVVLSDSTSPPQVKRLKDVGLDVAILLNDGTLGWVS